MASTEYLIDTLADQGWVVCDNTIDAALRRHLYTQSAEAWAAGAFQQAGIGRGATHILNTTIRGDTICWIEPAQASGASSDFLLWASGLRHALNRLLFTGLNRTE